MIKWGKTTKVDPKIVPTNEGRGNLEGRTDEDERTDQRSSLISVKLVRRNPIERRKRRKNRIDDVEDFNKGYFRV